MIDFTVAIRTHNSEASLPMVLDKLKTQVGIEEIKWEIIIVDNNSSDQSIEIIHNYQSNWNLSYPLKLYFEPKQGAAFARQKAMKEADGYLVGFLDDDNLPNDDWVSQAYHFGKKYPQAGAYGGQIHPIFEQEPPKNFQSIAVYLAIIQRGNKPFCYNNHKNKVLPPGAGIVINKQVWLETVPEKFFLSGPSGNSLSLKGEDMEFLSYIQNAGWEIWYNPNMNIYHTIPLWRLERNYLISLVKGVGLTRHHIRMIRLPWWQKIFAPFAYFVNDLRKLIFFFAKNYSKFKIDSVVACEMTLLLSILISPLFLTWVKLRNTLRKE